VSENVRTPAIDEDKTENDPYDPPFAPLVTDGSLSYLTL
jgi:hypothetical protein